MLLAVLIANAEGNILVERFNGVPSEERLHWRSFLVKLGAENLKGVKNEELLVACHKSVYIVYTVLGDVSIFLVGKDEYDELALAEAIFVVTSAVKDVCGKPPTERLFLDKYGRICLCLDEIVWKKLKDEVENLGYNEDTTQVTRDLLEFHNEIVLLLHYNTLNFEGLLKIIKKHKKKTGNSLNSAFMERGIQQRVFATDLLYKLLKECEAVLRQLL